MYGAVEAGGTKFVCAVGDEKGNITDLIQLKTETPDVTMPAVVDFFRKYDLKAIGVGSFGPVDIDPTSATYGYITATPKTAWKNYPILKTLQDGLRVPVAFDTDVNAAAYGEWKRGAAKGLDGCLYITVGTGIGAGAIVGGRVLQGFSHPEMGHIFVRRHPDDRYEGKCPYHKDCLEGLAAGPALEERWGKKGAELADRPEVWEMEASYLAEALVQYILILTPKKIIMGGGVMKQAQLFPLIRQKVRRLLNGYMPFPYVEDEIDDYIVPPALGDRAGITGALMMAIDRE
ncbi:ROK family protein [Caenibacillus caldisaponilyticus]|uniref:ROK family protein n=1 Tax=Caenibacillus caldisaponilyticus TaxID=1674942 RepID=UPI001875A87B|nr:ROK family protein [Caenibacillus caldisaponilyticus]